MRFINFCYLLLLFFWRIIVVFKKLENARIIRYFLLLGYGNLQLYLVHSSDIDQRAKLVNFLANLPCNKGMVNYGQVSV